MFKSASYILCCCAVFALQGSWAASPEKGQSVCLLSDPPNQCGQFCLRTLGPMQSKLASIEGKQDVMQTKLLAVQSRLEAQRTSLMSKLEDQTTSLKSELDGQLKGQNTEIQSKLDSQLQAVQSAIKEEKTEIQSKMDGQLQTVNSTLEAQGSKLNHQLQALQSALEAQQVAEQSRLDSQLLALQSEMKALHTNIVNSILLAVQEKLDEHKADLQESLKKMITREDFEARVNETEGKIGAVQANLPALQTAIEHQLNALQNQSGSQQKTLLENLSKMNSKIAPPKFELIGSRYFYIEQNLKQNWSTAAASCRQMGGYLAAFRDEQEWSAVTLKLRNDWYWIGINDIDNEDEFVSVASGRPAPFFLWNSGEPDHLLNQDCVGIKNTEMYDSPCRDEELFICQWDNEI
ncbi:C-type lectin domain family 4 member M-like [Drosophila takahashii]|uniref:C-type lectin domain family 4 member M-like n=1 Tax=Drosophila takahashii TaxID=29030 RepID=UPI001CF8CB25|nr:C-type lectin domain family 4 member M-like [Drosophila takahashii]